MCTVQRNITHSRRYIRNVYCAQKQNPFQRVHEKCVPCTETEHFPDGTSKMCTVHRNRTLSRRYIKNVYCAQKQNTFQTVIKNMYSAQKQNTFQKVIKNVYCAQKQNTFQTVHQKCVLCTETEQFPGGTSELCTVHRHRKLSRR